MRTFVFFLFASFVIFVSASCVALAQVNGPNGDGFDSEVGYGDKMTQNGIQEKLPFVYGVAVVHDMFLSYPNAVSIHSIWIDNRADEDNEEITVHFDYDFVGEIELPNTQFVERHEGSGEVESGEHDSDWRFRNELDVGGLEEGWYTFGAYTLLNAHKERDWGTRADWHAYDTIPIEID